MGQGVAVVVVARVVVTGAAEVGISHVVATRYGGGDGAGGGATGMTGGGGATALACILAIRACDLYMMPRRLSQSSLECRGGVSWHFVAPGKE